MNTRMIDLEPAVAAEATGEGYILVNVGPRPDGPEDASYALIDTMRPSNQISDLSRGRLNTLVEIRVMLRDLGQPDPQAGDPHGDVHGN